MAKITSEAAFEEHIEDVLLNTHGFISAKQEDYDKTLCLRPETVVSFIRATQTQKWADYCELIGDKAQATRNLLKRIKEVVDKAAEITDQAERTKLYQEAQKIQAEEMPQVNIAHSTVFEPISKKVTGYKVSPLGSHEFQNVDIAE